VLIDQHQIKARMRQWNLLEKRFNKRIANAKKQTINVKKLVS